MTTEATFDPLEGFLPGSLAALQQVVEAVDRAGDTPLWSLTTEQVEHVLGLVGWVRHGLDQLERHAVAEGVDRGLPADRGASPVDWVTGCLHEMVPAPPVGHAARVVRLAQAEAEDTFAELFARVGATELSTSKADQLVRFHREVAGVADPEMLSYAFNVLVDGASDLKEVVPERESMRTKGLSDKALATAITRVKRELRPGKDLEDEEGRARDGRVLFARPGAAGMTEYRWVLDPEGAAVVDAAVAAGSAPQPAQDGTPDPLSPARRRADALLEVVRRGAASAEDPASTPGPGWTRAQVVVTIGLEDLVEGLVGAGITRTDQVLSPATVRRMACEAGIVPLVLGTEGQPLDVGRTRRLFTPAQRTALFHRDQGCTFSGCTTPPQWCEAHHVTHWLHGGPTDLGNGALLCPRHHTHVHTHDLTATVTATGVTWHQ